MRGWHPVSRSPWDEAQALRVEMSAEDEGIPTAPKREITQDVQPASLRLGGKPMPRCAGPADSPAEYIVKRLNRRSSYTECRLCLMGGLSV